MLLPREKFFRGLIITAVNQKKIFMNTTSALLISSIYNTKKNVHLIQDKSKSYFVRAQ